MDEYKEQPHDIEVYEVELAHDYEESCRVLRQQIELYLSQWRELFGSEGTLSDTYRTSPTPEGSVYDLIIKSPAVNDVSIEASPVHTDDKKAEYSFSPATTLKTIYKEANNEPLVIEQMPQDEAEYARLYEMMRYIQACVGLEQARRAGGSTS